MIFFDERGVQDPRIQEHSYNTVYQYPYSINQDDFFENRHHIYATPHNNSILDSPHQKIIEPETLHNAKDSPNQIKRKV